MACLTVKLTQVCGDLRVDLSEICGVDLGRIVLVDKDGNRLLDSEDNILTAIKNTNHE